MSFLQFRVKNSIRMSRRKNLKKQWYVRGNNFKFELFTMNEISHNFVSWNNWMHSEIRNVAFTITRINSYSNQIFMLKSLYETQECLVLLLWRKMFKAPFWTENCITNKWYLNLIMKNLFYRMHIINITCQIIIWKSIYLEAQVDDLFA